MPLSSYLNQRAAFEIRPQEGLLPEVVSAFGSASDDPPAKQWQGIITSCEKLSVSKDETVYRFVLEPRFAAMKHFQTSRLFQHQTVPDIVAAVFKHHGFSGVDYRFQKSRSYSVREYITQYLESDFDFINRLCEEEGIWYAFEQHEQHGDVVVFGDSPEHYLRSQGLPVSYRPHAGLESVGTEALFNLSIRHNPIVEGIRTADYNYRSADTDLFAETDNKQSEESADNTVLLGKQQHWGLHPKTTDEAQVQTTLLNEANLCRQTVAAGSGNVVSMTPMKVFQTDISFPEAPDVWLVLSKEHSGSRDTAYSHTFTAIPTQLAYRPERTTPRPHISVNLFAQSSGIKMQANQGKVEVQAQNDELQLNALKDATLTSSAGKITIAAKEEILITCKGAYIKLSNGEVEIGSPKVVRVRAPLVVNGAKEMIFKLPMYPKISKNCLYTANMERSIYVLRPKD